MNNLSEQEKKALENVKNMFEGITIKSLNKDSKMTIDSLGIADILLFINAFEKQEKEIEELRKDNQYQWEERCRLTIGVDGLNEYISKDIIKVKIEEINKKSFENKCNYSEYYYKKEILEELLKE